MAGQATRFIRVALLSLLVLSIASCKRNDNSRQVVTFWAMGYEGEVVAQLIPEFERTHPASASSCNSSRGHRRTKNC